MISQIKFFWERSSKSFFAQKAERQVSQQSENQKLHKTLNSTHSSL